GVRSITAVKHFGFNVASDSILPVIYTGVKAGMVLLVADDPFGHSSAQSEQDSRFFAQMGNIPMIEPSNAQECKELTKKAFEISEKFQIPVMVRTTTMVSHSIGTVKLGKIPKPKTKGKFVKDPSRYYNIRPNLQKLHTDLLNKLEMIGKNYANLNSVEGTGRIGIIASGVSYEYVKELNINNVKLAKLVVTNPISKEFISDFLKGLETVVVIEELEPVIENFVRGVAKDANPQVVIHGKDILPRIGEFSCDIIVDALAPILNAKAPDFSEHEKSLKSVKIPTRKPVLCPGCPHRSTFYAMKKVFGKDTVWSGDVGCYVLGVFEPFKMQDFMLSMGASLGVAHGIKKVSNQRVVCFIGDSTFFHAGMPGIANLVHNDSKPIIIILDNSVSAMTGQQPHPGSDSTGMGGKVDPIKIEEVVKALGVKNVKVVSSYGQEGLLAAAKEFAKKDELGVIVSRGMCRLHMKRMLRSQGKKFIPFQIDMKKCTKCGICTDKFACPAIIKDGKKWWINADMCWGCGVCAQICPPKAISIMRPAGKPAETKGKPPEKTGKAKK
ncbi:MAG: 4Fe-4S binding protein, partial [Nanoarchaeota archaeon]|nr:4Fe-4S binding protein [Nanoarchaeota archaeon]